MRAKNRNNFFGLILLLIPIMTQRAIKCHILTEIDCDLKMPCTWFARRIINMIVLFKDNLGRRPEMAGYVKLNLIVFK